MYTEVKWKTLAIRGDAQSIRPLVADIVAGHAATQ